LRGSGAAGRCGVARGGLASHVGAEAELLERASVELAGDRKALSGLKALHGVDAGGVPFAGGLAFEDAFAGESGLDIADAVGGGSFLAAGAARAPLFGRGLLPC